MQDAGDEAEDSKISKLEEKIAEDSKISKLEEKITDLEGLVASLENQLANRGDNNNEAINRNGNDEALVAGLMARIQRLEAATDKPETEPDFPTDKPEYIPGSGEMGIPPLPSVPSILAWDATNGLHWAELSDKYKTAYRTASATVEGDFARAHS